MKTNSKINRVKVAQIIRGIYSESKKKDFTEQRRIWKNILWLLDKYGISEDLIIMDEFAFQEMSIPVIEHYYLSNK
jgi:hypothetical protein